MSFPLPRVVCLASVSQRRRLFCMCVFTSPCSSAHAERWLAYGFHVFRALGILARTRVLPCGHAKAVSWEMNGFVEVCGNHKLMERDARTLAAVSQIRVIRTAPGRIPNAVVFW